MKCGPFLCLAVRYRSSVGATSHWPVLSVWTPCEVSLGVTAGQRASWLRRPTTATWQQQRGKARGGAEPVFTLSLQRNW